MTCIQVFPFRDSRDDTLLYPSLTTKRKKEPLLARHHAMNERNDHVVVVVGAMVRNQTSAGHGIAQDLLLICQYYVKYMR